MSAPGQQIDPVQALASQQMAPQPQAVPPQEIDPVQALAMGQHVAPPAPPTAAPQPQSKGFADPSGIPSSIIRNMANAAMFNMGDASAAALGAIVPIPGYTSTKPTYGERYDDMLKAFRGYTQAGQKANPVTSLASSIAGGVLNPVTNAMSAPTSLGSALLQGAGIGGAYGFGSGVNDQLNPEDMAKQTGIGALTGAALAPVTYGLGKLLSGGTRSPEAQLLHDEGVPLTMGQNAGGTTQTLEDATTHIPMLGNAIKGRQTDAIEGFNLAGYNRALEPLGIKYSSDGPVGNEGIQKIGNLIGDAYGKAYEGATIQQSPNFSKTISQAISDASDALPKERVDMISKNINNRLIGKFDANGNLPNDALISAKNWFAEQSRAGPTASLDERAISKAYGDVVDAIKDGISETDPDKGALLNAADNSYMRFTRLAQAAGQNAKTGVYTPSQFGTALRSMDNSTRRMNFAKGLAPMQDLAQAGLKVLPSTVPDSGTAIRGLLELGAGGALTHAVAPEAAIPALGAIGAGTALYSRPGQQLANALIYGAPAARKAIGALPVQALPGILAAVGTESGRNKLGQFLQSKPQSEGQ